MTDQRFVVPPLPVLVFIAAAVALMLLSQATEPEAARAQAPASCPNQMVAYWKLDERGGTVFDDFAGNNDATCAGGTCPAPVADGQVNGAQQFDGSTSAITVTASPDFDWGANASFSVELWMKANSAETCVGTSSDDNEVLIGRTEGSRLHWWVGCAYGAAGGGRAAFQLRDRGGANDVFLTGPAIADGQPHHVVAVRDDAVETNYLYVDGTLVDTDTINYTRSFTSSVPLDLGWLDYPNGPKYHYAGMLDEVAIYGRPLTPAEIQQHYTAGLGGQGYCEPAGTPTPTPEGTTTPTPSPTSTSTATATATSTATATPTATATRGPSGDLFLPLLSRERR